MDPLAEKYYSISPYAYCAGNPVNRIDADGRDIVVLNAPKGANNAGHMAMLIQNKNGTWSLWSKNGTNENHGLSGPNDKGDQRGKYAFKSPEDFMKSDKNPLTNNKTGEREYTEGYLIKASKKEDRAAEKGATTELNKDYNVLGSNCAKTVQSGLEAAGKQDGSPSSLSLAAAEVAGALIGGPVGAAVTITIDEKTPKLIYERIKEQNKGEVVK